MAMGALLPLGFIGLPILDILSLIKAGALLGFWPTLAWVAGGVVVGVVLIRLQGVSIGRSVQQSLNAGKLPVVEAFDGACILLAGCLLLMPGLVSDLLALLLLLPPVRGALRRAISARMRHAGATVVWTSAGEAAGGGRAAAGQGPVIDGEFESWEAPTPPTPQPATAAPPLPPPSRPARPPGSRPGSD
jgi:UPF0716 protein FxsA